MVSLPRLNSAKMSLWPGSGIFFQNFSHSSRGARSANEKFGVTNGPW